MFCSGHFLFVENWSELIILTSETMYCNDTGASKPQEREKLPVDASHAGKAVRSSHADKLSLLRTPHSPRRCHPDQMATHPLLQHYPLPDPLPPAIERWHLERPG